MKQLQHIDINTAIVEGLNDSARAHLAACAECRQEFETTSGALSSLKSIDLSLESVPESFWQAQQRAIRIGAADAKPKRTMTAIYAWAGATAAAALVALSLIPADKDISKMAPAPKMAQTEMSDAALLESVQDRLEGYPEAIHPAQVMYAEMASAKNTASSVLTKRK